MLLWMTRPPGAWLRHFGLPRLHDLTGMHSTTWPSWVSTAAACSSLSSSTRGATPAAATSAHLHAAYQVRSLGVGTPGSAASRLPTTEVLGVYRQAVLRLQHVTIADPAVSLSTMQHFLYDFQVLLMAVMMNPQYSCANINCDSSSGDNNNNNHTDGAAGAASHGVRHAAAAARQPIDPAAALQQGIISAYTHARTQPNLHSRYAVCHCCSRVSRGFCGTATLSSTAT